MSGTVNWILNNADIITNIANNLYPVQRLISGASYVMGLGFAFKSLQAFKQLGESRSAMSSQHGMKEPVIYLIVASVFIFLPTAIAIMLQTTFGTSSPLTYPTAGSSPLDAIFGSKSELGQSLVVIIQTIGLIAFIRGWILISRSAGQSSQPGSIGKAIMHIFGGVAALNIVLMIQIINNTLYGT